MVVLLEWAWLCETVWTTLTNCRVWRLLRMWTASSTTPRTATARRSGWGSPSSVAAGRATRRRRAWGTTPSTSTHPSPPRSCARFKARRSCCCCPNGALPRPTLLPSPTLLPPLPLLLPLADYPKYRPAPPSRPHTKRTSACFKFSPPSIFFFCVIQFLFLSTCIFWKSIFVVFLALNICTLVYAITLLFLYGLTDKVLSTKKQKTTERKRQKTNDMKEERGREGKRRWAETQELKQEAWPSPAPFPRSSRSGQKLALALIWDQHSLHSPFL